MSSGLILRYLPMLLIGLSLAAPSAWAATFRKLDPAMPPPLVLKDINGGNHDLANYRGKVILVNFWASWCPPCREEMPSMRRLKQKLDGKPFAILAVASGEEAQDSIAFLDIINVNFDVLPDPDAVVTKRWKVYGLPTSFLIGPDGQLRYALTGPAEWDEQETMQLIESLFP